MKWIIAADFLRSKSDIWLDDFIDDPALEFEKLPPGVRLDDWHHQKSPRTSLGRWFRHFGHARRALQADADGVVTCFPQLALAAGLLKRLGLGEGRPIVAYNFNIGTLVSGPRQRLVRAAAPAIDRFVVHSPSEVAAYAAYTNLPESRFHFVALQGIAQLPRDEDVDKPFILSMGSAHRDYGTLVEALEELQFPTVIVARGDIIERLPVRPWIDYRSGLTEMECYALLARARLSVTPISNMDTASGQVTFVNAMRMGVATIVTRCPGTDGYIEDGQNARLVPPFDAGALAREIRGLWEDREARDALAGRAKTDADERFSDEFISGQLRRILAEFC